MRRKGVTSIELAKIAGVASATISRAFSANSRISTVTRERILSIAREHNYHPNAVARSLNNRQWTADNIVTLGAGDRGWYAASRDDCQKVW
jgi:DNA-binding LacI/PurR family transcriptional regulator